MTKNTMKKKRAQFAVTALSITVFGLLLFCLTDPASGYLPTLPSLLGVIGILLLVLGVALLSRGWATVWILSSALVFIVFIRLTHYTLLQFSGGGFGPEFFFHLSLEAARIATHEYWTMLLALGFMSVLAFVVVFRLVFAPGKPTPLSATVLIFSGVALLITFRYSLPEWDFSVKAWRYLKPGGTIHITEEDFLRWEATGLVKTDLVSKTHLDAHLPDKPVNLILLYLEGVNTSLIGHNQWPGLTPNLERLLHEHSLVDNWYTSADITMEGLVNSQCGTLFPFFKWEHDSFTGSIGLGDNMVCLSDVLERAGYYQIFMGGALESFGGKDSFLKAHGYNEVLGWSHWNERGLTKKTDPWGLGDPDLYHQAILRLHQLKDQETPWSLTLLTLGTHVPGYFYEECEPFDRRPTRRERTPYDYLDALHCTDQLLGDWVAELVEIGALEDTLLIITSDHAVFPNPRIVRKFGPQASDQRLPFIVMGQNRLRPLSDSAGAYDLAPSALDMMGIEHNAKFALGRSLFRVAPQRNYFLSPYTDYHAGSAIENPIDSCIGRPDLADSPQFPLEPCEKKVLFSVLASLVEKQSVSSDINISCPHPEPLSINVSAAGDGNQLGIRIGDIEISTGFSAYGNIVHPGTSGLYIAALSADGGLILRHYLDPNDPPERYQTRLRRIFTEDESVMPVLLVVWVPGRTTPPGTRLPIIGRMDTQHAGLWILDRRTSTLFESVTADYDTPLKYILPQTACTELFMQM